MSMLVSQVPPPRSLAGLQQASSGRRGPPSVIMILASGFRQCSPLETGDDRSRKGSGVGGGEHRVAAWPAEPQRARRPLPDSGCRRAGKSPPSQGRHAHCLVPARRNLSPDHDNARTR